MRSSLQLSFHAAQSKRSHSAPAEHVAPVLSFFNCALYSYCPAFSVRFLIPFLQCSSLQSTHLFIFSLLPSTCQSCRLLIALFAPAVFRCRAVEAFLFRSCRACCTSAVIFQLRSSLWLFFIAVRAVSAFLFRFCSAPVATFIHILAPAEPVDPALSLVNCALRSSCFSLHSASADHVVGEQSLFAFVLFTLFALRVFHYRVCSRIFFF